MTAFCGRYVAAAGTETRPAVAENGLYALLDQKRFHAVSFGVGTCSSSGYHTNCVEPRSSLMPASS
jgi:hypothetical protein